MRLINTETLELQEFFDSDIPPYAILSHRWEQDEISYKDMLEGKKRKGAGYAKIRNFCAIALRDAYGWAWVDTCCIDKSSSADLSEAINAMFGWYQRSKMCYVYLSDVERHETETGATQWPTFGQSKWFTRGWTLQELIAPERVTFYDHYWHIIGCRPELLNDVSAATGIPSSAIENSRWRSFSVAQRMSWAAKRETSRIEDIAYCLLGLFNVRMALLYGEGAFAFKRLQEEIIKVSADESILVWSRPQTRFDHGPLLADSPACFAACGGVTSKSTFWRKPYSITNKGLRLSTSLYDVPQRPKRAEFGFNDFLIPLNCWLQEAQNTERSRVALQLRSYYEYKSSSAISISYDRTGWCKMPAEAKQVANTKTIYITQNSRWEVLGVDTSPNVQLEVSRSFPRMSSTLIPMVPYNVPHGM